VDDQNGSQFPLEDPEHILISIERGARSAQDAIKLRDE
jgi:hypothetical protein